MILSHTRRLAGLLALVSLIASANVRAGDGSPGESLRSVGLIKNGGLYILKRESAEATGSAREAGASKSHVEPVPEEGSNAEAEALGDPGALRSHYSHPVFRSGRFISDRNSPPCPNHRDPGSRTHMWNVPAP
jgi:hypothetical protein